MLNYFRTGHYYRTRAGRTKRFLFFPEVLNIFEGQFSTSTTAKSPGAEDSNALAD